MKLRETNILIFIYSSIFAESESFGHEFHKCSMDKLPCHCELIVGFLKD